MLNINVRTPGVKQQIRRLDRIQKQQVPFALANTINDLLFEGRKAETSAMQRSLDRPTPFTLKGLQVTKASKRKLTGVLFIPDNRWKYMQYPVEGGVQVRTHAIPVNRKTNKYGGLPKGARGPKGKREFIAEMKSGKVGVFKRRTKKRLPIDLMVSYSDKVQKRRIYAFKNATIRNINQRAETLMQRNLARALRTAR